MSDWRPLGIHDIATGIDWNDPSRLTNCDPYLIWADLNATVTSESSSRISLLVEVTPDFDWDHEDTLGVTQLPWLANRRPGQPTIVPCVVKNIGDLVKVVNRVGRDVLRLTLCRPRVDIRWMSMSDQIIRVNRRRDDTPSNPPEVPPCAP